MGAAATGSLKALVKVGKTVGREAVRPGGGYKVGGIRWKEAEPTSRLRTTNRQRNRFLEKVSRFHEFFSYSPVGTSNIGAGGQWPHHPSWSGKPRQKRYCLVKSGSPTATIPMSPRLAVIQDIVLAPGLCP